MYNKYVYLLTYYVCYAHCNLSSTVVISMTSLVVYYMITCFDPSGLLIILSITLLSPMNVTPLPCARQHPSYGDCLEVKREYYQNSSAAHLYEQFLQVKQIGFVTLEPLCCV